MQPSCVLHHNPSTSTPHNNNNNNNDDNDDNNNNDDNDNNNNNDDDDDNNNNYYYNDTHLALLCGLSLCPHHVQCALGLCLCCVRLPSRQHVGAKDASKPPACLGVGQRHMGVGHCREPLCGVGWRW